MTLPAFPLVSIVTVNFNGYEFTVRCLDSLTQLDYPNYEVIVVDNGSSQEVNWSELEIQYPKVQFIYLSENTGFAGGNNRAFEIAKGELIWMLNNDTEVDPNSLNYMVQTMQEHTDCGMCSSRLLYFEPKGLVQYAGMTDLNPVTMRNRSIGYREEMDPDFEKVYPTSFIHGASALVRSSAMKRLGYMREVYFLYYEEYDWCWRMRDAGYSIYYDGRAVVYHKESAVTKPNSPLKTYYLIRNRILFARLNFHGLRKWSSILFTSCVAGPKAIITELMAGRVGNIPSICRAYIWNIVNRKASLR